MLYTLINQRMPNIGGRSNLEVMMFTLTYLEMTRALAEAERVYRACDDDAKEIVSEP